MFHGKGILKSEVKGFFIGIRERVESYEGEFKENLFDGFGKIIHWDASTYEG